MAKSYQQRPSSLMGLEDPWVAYMVDRAADLRPEWIAGKRRIGVTAGASAPEVLVNELIERLKALGAESVRPLDGIVERVVFTLPRELSAQRRGA